MRKVVFIDFHGTLAYKSYSETLKEVLDEKFPDNVVSSADFRSVLDGTYFWDFPNTEHTHLNTRKKWWAVMLEKIEGAYSELGYKDDSKELALTFKSYYTDADKYKVYDDSISGLKSLRHAGCKVCIASNHVPELKKIIRKMPIGKYINRVYTSGKIGYEKPNRKFYDTVLEKAGNPEKCVMIGDNVLADIQGAQIAGIPAILIRNTTLKAKADYFANDMDEAVEHVKEILELKISLWCKIGKWFKRNVSSD